MPITSISLLRLKAPPFFSSSFRRRHFFSISAAARQNPSNTFRKLHHQQQPRKHLLKARDTVKKHLSTLAPVLSPDEKLKLLSNQAVGLVAASQANFMRVVIQSSPSEGSTSEFSGDKLDGNRDEFVKIEGSRSSGEVYNGQFSGEKLDEFVEVEGSRSSADVSGVQFQSKAAIEAFRSKIPGEKLDEFGEIEGSRSYDDVSGVRFSKTEASGSEISGEGSRSSDEVSGVQFSYTEVSGSGILVKQLNDFGEVEGSRSSGDVSGGPFLHKASRSGINGNGNEFSQVEGSSRFNEVSAVRLSQSEAPIEKLEESGGEGVEMKGGVELLCVVKAVLKKIKRRVLVGDKVLVGSIDWVDRRGMIENVFERKSEVLDPPVANVDHLVVLFSMDQPKIEPFALTRFLVEAESTGIPFFLALNKSELVDEETLFEWKARLRKWGYNPVFCSIESKRGLDSLQFLLREQTSVIVGPSGVGKSSLINALRGNNPVSGLQQDDNWSDHILGSKWLEEQRVGEISMRSGRGKHTTRHVSLLPLTGGGYLADTPGFNQPSLIKVTKQSLEHHFPEIRKMLEDSEPKKCAFNNCLHIGEPGCIVKGDWERYPYYLQLLDEIRIREEFQLRTVGTKREGDVRYKTGELGVVQAEPRLEPKKHRRVSRKKANQSIMDDLDEYDNDDDDKDLVGENPVIRAVREEQL